LHEKFSGRLAEHRQVLQFVNLDHLPDIHGDSRLVSKVFANLIENAIQHTPRGGKIIIKGAHRVAVNDKKAHSEVQVTISDNGPGIDVSVQSSIFERTFRNRSSRTPNPANDSYAGLGLAVVDGIVRAHGGRVWVESRGRDVILNPGSHFHVVLPAVQVAGRSTSTLPTGAMV
jgi:signal transduction histidine kinase